MASPSFLSWVKGYNWSQLCSVYLRMETLRKIPKQLPKVHLFRGNSCLLRPDLNCLIPLWWDKRHGVCSSVPADKIRPGKFSFSAFCWHLTSSAFPSPSTCFCTTLGGAYRTGSLTTLSTSGTIGPSSHPKCQGTKSTPLDHPLQIPGAHWHLR